MTPSCPFRLAVFDQFVSAGGVRRFTLAMLEQWLALASPTELHITLFWPAHDTAQHELVVPFSPLPPHLTIRRIPPGLKPGEGLAWLAPQSQAFDAIYFPSTVHMLRPETEVVLHAPVIATLHDLAHEFTPAWGPYTALVRHEMRQWTHFAHTVIFSSDYIRNTAARLYHIPIDKTRRVYLAPPLVGDAPPTAEQVVALRQKYQLPERFLLSPGTAMIHKNPAVILEAVGQLKQAGRGLPLVLIGPLVDELQPGRQAPTTSDYHRRLQQRITELNLSLNQDLYLLGHIPDEELPLMYAASSAVVTASHSEAGLSGPIFEGMWYQRPVLCSSIPQFVERLGSDDELVYMFDPNDAQDLTHTIQRWSADLPAAQRRAQRAREWVQTRSWADPAREYLDIFQQAAQAFKRPATSTQPIASSSVRQPQAFGFNVIGHVSGNLGLGVLARNLIQLLTEHGYPVNVLDIDPGLGRGGSDRRFDSLAVTSLAELTHPINLLVLPAPSLPWMTRTLAPALARPGTLNAALLMWELTAFNPDWANALQLLDVIVAESNFIRHAADFNLSHVRTISAVPPLTLPDQITPDRARWGMLDGTVVFVASFEPFSDPTRKNPLAVIAAFRHAFEHNGRAQLILKLNNFSNPEAAANREPFLRWLRQNGANHPRIRLLTDNLSYAEVLSLYASADVYVSLHRAEGLGLGLMEAMALGKPVIATAWSGNMTFMNHTNACLVGYRLVPVDGAIPAYRKENFGGQTTQWADPNVAEAAAWMQRLAEHPAVRAEIGRQAAHAMARLQATAHEAQFVDELRALWEQQQFFPTLALEKRSRLQALSATPHALHQPLPFVVKPMRPASAAPHPSAPVDIVIPIYGQAALLQKCVASVLKTAPEAHLILVDDCSPGDEIQRAFQQWLNHPRITLARTSQNSGFIGACQVGAALGQSPFILFLNSDTEAIDSGWLEKMLPAEDSIAIVGALLLYPPHTRGPLAGTIQHAGVARKTNGVPYHPFIGLSADTPEATVARDVNAVTGGCLLIRRAVWEELGGWDARFGKGVYEDVDLCWRARQKGYRVLYQPAARFYHAESASKAPDGHHALNAHTQENLKALREKWPHLASDEDLFFGEKTARRWDKARKQLARAQTALQQKNMQTARIALRKALELADDLADVRLSYAQLLSAQGEHAPAAEQLEAALRLLPAAWVVRLQLVDAWQAAHQPQKAAAALQPLLEVFPNLPEVQQRAGPLGQAARAPEPPPSAAPHFSAAAVETVQFLLRQPDLAAALHQYADQLNPEVLALVRLNANTARADGNAELAAALDNFAAHIQRALEQRALRDRAALTFQQLLDAEDVAAALEANRAHLDEALLEIIHANALSAQAEGNAELVEGLEALAEHIGQMVLSPA